MRRNRVETCVFEVDSESSHWLTAKRALRYSFHKARRNIALNFIQILDLAALIDKNIRCAFSNPKCEKSLCVVCIPLMVVSQFLGDFFHARVEVYGARINGVT